jgi:hypothetical protein
MIRVVNEPRLYLPSRQGHVEGSKREFSRQGSAFAMGYIKSR